MNGTSLETCSAVIFARGIILQILALLIQNQRCRKKNLIEPPEEFHLSSLYARSLQIINSVVDAHTDCEPYIVWRSHKSLKAISNYWRHDSG